MAELRFYWVVFAAGGILMALEILSSRVLAPHFGNSVYVWGSIISIFLAALSVGYMLGGQLADRQPSMALLGRLVVVVALCQAVLMIYGERLAGALGDLTGGTPTGTLLAAGLLFGPVSVLLGMVSPFAVRLAAKEVAQMGNTAGRLYALSTAGSLVGTLGCTFLLIPFLQLGQIFGLLLALTALTALVALVGHYRAETIAAASAVLLVIVAIPQWAPTTAYGDAIYKRITPYQTLQVLEEDGVRYLRSDNINHAAVRVADGRPALSYTQISTAAVLLNPEIQNVLVLGMGAGNVGAYLHLLDPAISVEYAEIDPAVVEVAREFFGFSDGDARQVHVADARRYLAGSDRRWDMIFCDTYIGLSVPFHLSTLEFFDQVREHLTPDGVLAVNLAGGIRHPFSRAIYRTVLERFSAVYLFQSPHSQNVMLIAQRKGEQLTTEELVARGRELDRQVTLPLPLATVAARRVEVDLTVSETPILRDAFAPVERLVNLRPDP
jgi:spermidine synthase